jgi:hypothetical protein
MGLGALGSLAELFIGVGTLRSGYAFGSYDLLGTGLGLLALVLMRPVPWLAGLLWLAAIPCLVLGRLLVSVACFPVPLLPLSAGILAIYSWEITRKASHRA